MSKKVDPAKSTLVFELDPNECPFREFRDNELATEFWGLGPAALRAAMLLSKTAAKPSSDHVWVDDQTQPLPRSVRHYLHGWVRAEDLALRRWEAEVMVFEENNDSKMSVIDTQLTHAQVLLRSSFCRKVLSQCFILERVEGLVVEHQWENFIFSFGPEGWRARYHIYCPGMKPGGGQQHRPGLSKNGCYLVRLFYLGTWRCVWVSDQVPVDANDSPLLPFSPLLSGTQAKAAATKQPPVVNAPVVYLWPLLMCKALLKLVAPDMNSDEDVDCWEDESLPQFDVQHALTGGMNLTYHISDAEDLWNLITIEVPVFSWDEDDDTLASTIRSKSTKKPATKEISVVRRSSMTTLLIEDTKGRPPYALPGITPGHEMTLLVTMARDLPLKKPLPEPDVALWKHYRWVDWARRHGLYEAYDCPRTRFLKVNGLLKLSHAPHLLDVQSTESITFQFREEHDKMNPPTKKTVKELNRSATGNSNLGQQAKEELREWLQFNAIYEVVKNVSVLFYPSMFEFTSAASSPPVRVTKTPVNRALDIPAPKFAPLYLQVDGPDENVLRISLSMLHPRTLLNSGVPVMEHVEPAYLLLELFEWFIDCDLPVAKAFISTRGYESVEIKFLPGRHVCRIWVHSRMNWHASFLSESTLLLGSRDIIQCAAVRECPWASRFLSNLGSSFNNWIRVSKSSSNMMTTDKEFYKSYQPDLEWNAEEVGYDKAFLHWMFRKALEATLIKKLSTPDFGAVCPVLRRYFCDPDFGFPDKPLPPKSLRDIALADPCDCVMPEMEEVEIFGEQVEEEISEEKPIVSPLVMDQLLKSPVYPNISKVCELATEEVPCGVLKDEREKIIQRHEAATVIQAYWRGTWARKCLNKHVFFTPEVLKLVMENAFGNLEALSALMNKFFEMFPSTKRAYSLSSALTGLYEVQQFSGSAYVTPKCKWIPFFQGVFHCHGLVKAHLDVESSIAHSTLAVYDNDTGEKMPQVYNAHITFDFKPNYHGYTVMGHGSLNQASGTNFEAHWQLTILCSIAHVFHVCDNDIDMCKEIALPHASKLHIDEIFVPNRRNILGGIEFTVTKHEIISFRAASTSPDLEMEAVLSTTNNRGEKEEVERCSGKGELYWPYIRLEPMPPIAMSPFKRKSNSQANLGMSIRESAIQSSARSLKNARVTKPLSASSKNRSTTKLKDFKATLQEPKHYTIQVIAPNGWPLTLAQWSRVDEIRNSPESIRIETPSKKATKEKPGSAKEKEKAVSPPLHQPQPGDAYVELECSLALMGGSIARRDDARDVEFATARRAWDAKEHGRNARGAHIRKEFRAEFLEALPPPPSDSVRTIPEEMHLGEELEGEEKKLLEVQPQQGPTPASESGMLEMSVESEEEPRYLTMPEQLKDKFIPLYFVPFCTKEKNDDKCVLITPEMADASKRDREFRIKASLERMKELQTFNEEFVLGRQKRRCQLLEKLFTDSQWNEDLTRVLEERDEAIAREALMRTLSATKKKQEVKKK